jgi:hypothetical protein
VGVPDHEHDTGDQVQAGADRVYETFTPNGDRVRYKAADFDEILTTAEEPEMRRLVGLGWLLLDEQIDRQPVKSSSWVDLLFRRAAGRVLPAQDDPAYAPPTDVATYVLGHLKTGAGGTR